jgi:hypothetical protein
MIVMGSMPLALITTGLAGRRARRDHCPEDAEIRRGLADRDPGSGVARVGAVEAETNAAHHRVHVVLREIGVGATRAAGATLEALFDAAQESVVIDTCRVRMCLEYVVNRHVRSPLLCSYCRSGEGGMRVSPRIPSTTKATLST